MAKNDVNFFLKVDIIFYAAVLNPRYLYGAFIEL